MIIPKRNHHTNKHKMKKILRVLWISIVCLCGLSSANTFAQVSNYAFRQTIKINNASLTGIVTDFAVPVRLNTSNFDFSKMRSDGYDIRFSSDSTGTALLSYDREMHTATEAVYWVRLPSVSNGTTFYMFYGNPSATNGESKTNTWAGYGGVWHFNETGGTDEGAYVDASGNVNNGTRIGTVNRGTGTTARFGGALNLNPGNKGYVEIPHNTNVAFTN